MYQNKVLWAYLWADLCIWLKNLNSLQQRKKANVKCLHPSFWLATDRN